MLTLTGGELIIKLLKNEGIRNVFGVCGGRLTPILKGIYEESGITYIGTRHEAHAAHMACATYHASGVMGVCIGEIGAAANLIPGVATAFGMGIPMLVITSNNPSSLTYPFEEMMMEIDNEHLFRPVTKWNAVVREVQRLPSLVRRALREALSGKPGPVHLDIPFDVLFQKVKVDEALFNILPYHYRPLDRPRGDLEKIKEAVELMI
ncbi:MAG: hypothetical protein K6T31_00070, partial [Alicyclobacillus sp.]|nr:hypothetical protein [Alicyclobacillus sp.]